MTADELHQLARETRNAAIAHERAYPRRAEALRKAIELVAKSLRGRALEVEVRDAKLGSRVHCVHTDELRAHAATLETIARTP